MSLKDTLQKKLETQTDSWSRQIDSLKADARERIAKAKDEHAERQIRKDFDKEIEKLEGRMDEAKKKIAEIRESGEDHLNKLKGRIDDWLSKRD
ncbi:sll1863 family stress response protein [Marinobacter confluentis]|uniref:Coiled coil domain-containing protein n=1 Tax=Marinobacter confluentis TaxID=1697557 RepID=A0A4Z1BR87_9GAMM|nr:hypothetical protein [Marinobacter confluentis]TGN40105.1 hypothetical protein E5Q11_07370 [Marinobacter confluentis]